MRMRRRMRYAAALCLLLFCLMVALAAVWPEASGTDCKTGGNLTVDASNAKDGYVMIHGPETSRKLKLRITRDDTTFTYDLNGAGEYEVFPLQLGSGGYTCTLYQNVKGNQYSEEGQVSLSVTMENEEAAFLCPNQYVNYTADSPAVQKAEELCAGLSGQQAIFDTVKGFVESSFTYDFVAAVTVQPGQMPNPDGCFEKKMGICQDLAAMTVSMLRTQGVPARLMIGYADKQYHAWLTAFIDGEEVFYDPTAALGGIAKPHDYTMERYY